MGVVHAAYDPKLDRKIALKLLAPQRTHRFRDALLAEAQAMAKLTHPNVVAVHDVGTHGDRVFIAMEYVPGRTLRKAMGGRAIPWREALRVLIPAGRGLAAAHAAGIVHRDFKPENVLLGADGRICVVDFGIARPTKKARPHSSVGWTPSTSSEATEVRASAISGTAAYMPPEQFVQNDADVRSDQFAFCVVLFEALSGQSPFATTLDERKLELLTRREPIWPPETNAPRWLRRVVCKGLRFDPYERYPTMEALLQALRRGPRARRAVLGTGLVLAGGLMAASVVARGMLAPSLCTGMDRHLAGVWDDATRARLRAQAAPDTRLGLVYVEAVLDTYAESLTHARTETCAATRITGEQSEARMDRHMACLDTRHQHLEALVGLLDLADDQHALAAARALPSVSSCADGGELEHLALPHDPAVRARVRELREAIAHAEASLDLGLPPPSPESVVDIIDVAREMGDAPLLADALLTLARITREAGRLEASEQAAVDALAVGARAKNDRIIARGWLSLLTTLSHSPDRGEAFERVAQAAELATLRHGDAHTRLVLLTEMGAGLGRQGRFEEAKLRFEEALELVEATRDTDPLMHARAANNLGATLERLGDYDAAAHEHARAIELIESTLGPDHPAIASSLTNLGSVHAARFDHETAIALHERAIGLIEATRGAHHPSLLPPLVNSGFALVELHRHGEAQERFMRTIELAESTLGPSHPILSYALVGLGRTFVETERGADALRHLERAQLLLPPEAVDTNLRGELRFSLARAIVATDGDLDLARELCRAASDDFAISGTASDRLQAIGRWLADQDV